MARLSRIAETPAFGYHGNGTRIRSHRAPVLFGSPWSPLGGLVLPTANA